MFEQYVHNSGHLQNAPPASIIVIIYVKNALLKVVFKLLTVWSADGMIALTKASAQEIKQVCTTYHAKNGQG